MVQTKEEFIKSFLPDTVENIELTQISMDITDLGLGDILRNINKIYPYNSRTRNSIISGNTVVGVLCKTKLLYPLMGIFILVSSDKLSFDLISTNYLVVCISEKAIRDNDSINNAIYNLTTYLLENYKNILRDLPEFYRKFIYDPSELDEDDYIPDGD